MSERCEHQPPPAGPADSDSERLSLGAAAFVVVAALLFYTWWVTIAVGAVCGSLAALCIARSRRVRAYATLLKLYLSGAGESFPQQCTPQQGVCAACGVAGCARHDPRVTLEPWVGLRLHKQLDQAIEDFYNAIIERFVSSWFDNVTRQPFFKDELRHQLRYASAALLRRAIKINYAKFIVDKLVPCALHHHAVWTEAQRHRRRSEDASRSVQREQARSNGSSDDSQGWGGELSAAEAAALDGPLRCALHPAARSRAAELRYLRCVAAAVMPHLLRAHDLHNRVFQVLIREIFAGWVLLSLTDVLADPYILNTLIVLATGDETMSSLPKTPDYRRYPYLPSICTIFLTKMKIFLISDCNITVEFLEHFVSRPAHVSSRRARLLRLDLAGVLARQDHFYAFMQYMKATGHLHLLQFCRDIKPFQMKILNPELTQNEEVALFNEAWDLYVRYFDADGPCALPFPPRVADEMRAVLASGAANVGRLRTSKALYESANYADDLLESVFLPQFLHSEEFYKAMIGPRIPTGYQKLVTKKSQDKLVSSAIRLGSKLRGALRSQTIEGQILDCFTNTIDITTDMSVTDGDGIDNMNILRYLDSLAEHTKMEEHDLRNWRVTITDVETRQLEGRRDSVRAFTLAVRRAVEGGGGWAVRRSEHDFHLLRSKLVEFHGDALLQELTLPSRRDNSPPETLRYKYEDYVQRLLQKSLLATSELLRIFLSADGDFGLAVQRASLGAGGPDLSNLYQSVAHRLRKEKGQHLEPFMSAFLLSSDVERYQAMKQSPAVPVEEAEEVDEARVAAVATLPRRARDIRDQTFCDNFAVYGAAPVQRVECAHQTRLTGFSRCLMYLLSKVLRARGSLCVALGCVAAACGDLLDQAFALALNATLADVLSERRLAHLIRLGHELLFGSEPQRRQPAAEQRARARAQLEARTPRALALALGARARPALADLHDMLQSARLNKQLVYNLLDLCIVELFPELIEDSPSLKSR